MEFESGCFLEVSPGRAYLGNPPRTAAFINKAVAGIQAAGSLGEQKYRDLKANPEAMAELMKE